jgi:DNA polymerase III alpha subunit (gram-positive type)
MKKYILFDTEYTAWKNSLKTDWSKPNEYREIIQISAFKINNGKVIKILNIYVKPNINKTLSTYITNLTGITNYKIKNEGISFKKAIEKFYKFSGSYNLYSYGNDFDIIKENLLLNEITELKYYNWGKKFKDFKKILKKKSNINPSKYTSGTIYKAFNIKMTNEFKPHNSFNDIQSMFEVCKIIL